MNFNWDDMRVFLEIQRTGRLNRAAKRLGSSHTTVARRLKTMEAGFGLPLFESTEDGLVLSEFGNQVLAHAHDMEAAATAISDQADRLTGQGTKRVRVGSPDGFGNAVLSHILPQFMASDPTMEVELIPLPVTHKLWRRDVDIAISLDRPQTGRLVMRKLTDYDLRLYAGPQFFEDRPRPKCREDLRSCPFVGYVDELLYTRELDFNTIILPGLNIIYRGATIKSQFDAVRGNVGLGVLPYFMARGTDLEPVLPDAITFSRTYWLLYPEEYRDLDRIRRVSDFIFDATRNMAEHFKYSPEPSDKAGTRSDFD